MLWNGRMGNTDIRTELKKIGQTRLPDWTPRLVFWLYVVLYLTWFSGVFGF